MEIRTKLRVIKEFLRSKIAFFKEYLGCFVSRKDENKMAEKPSPQFIDQCRFLSFYLM